jgi:hypothetical protein
MDLKCSHHIKASPQSCKVAKLALRSLEHGRTCRKFGLYGPNPCVSIKGLFCFSECWGLHPDKLSVGGNHLWSIMISSHWRSLLHQLGHLMLCLQNLVQHFGLGGHESLHWRHGWWRW